MKSSEARADRVGFLVVMDEERNAKFNTDKQLQCEIATALFRNVYDKKFIIRQQSICKHGKDKQCLLQLYLFLL